MPRDDSLLLDILLAARKIKQFSEGMTREGFESDEIRQFAIMHAIQIIGEAARNISDDFKRKHSMIPWRRMIGMRHHLVHEYFDIDTDQVWQVVEVDIPALIPLIEPLVPPDENS